MKSAWLLLASVLFLASAAPPAPIDDGPKPEWGAGVRAAEAAVRARLIDPESARFEWPYDFSLITRKPVFGQRVEGWTTCGFVNAHNRMGGFTGRSWVYIVERRDVVTNIAIGESEQIDVANVLCEEMRKKSLLPPAPMEATSDAPLTMAQVQSRANEGADSAAANGGLGISFLPTPYGAMLVAVAAASPAARAALKQGEVIEAINGISIKGMDQAKILDILSRVGREATFSIVGVGDVKVTKP